MTRNNTNADSAVPRCPGCGIPIQSTDPEQPGYAPKAAQQREQPAVCRRCYRIRHYNEAASVTVDQDEFLKLLGRVGESEALVLHIVDLFDFDGSLIPGLHRFVGRNPVILAVNKIDLLPQNINLNRILNWVQRAVKLQGLKVEDIVFCSAKKGRNFDRVLASVDALRGNRDVYVVGATNVGKSSLINRLIKDYSELDQELTVSRYPGTTLDLIRIPLDDGHAIMDTPGIVYPYRLTELVAKPDLQILLPEHPLKPAVYQLQERQTLFFGAMARFDFIKGAAQSFTCYVSNRLKIHRTKLENADELYRKHKGELLSPPDAQELDRLPPLVRHDIRIPKGSPEDVLISGLGWVKVNSDAGAELNVYAPKGVKVIARPAMI